MPKQDIQQLSQRVQNLNLEVEVVTRRKEEEARNAAKALSSISEEAIELLKPIVPELQVICKFTAQQIADNRNGEEESIKEVLNKLTRYVSERLDYYEAGL